MDYREMWMQLKADIEWTKRTISSDINQDYSTGFLCALSNVEGRIAEMENENEAT
jgi:hypothetical protein